MVNNTATEGSRKIPHGSMHLWWKLSRFKFYFMWLDDCLVEFDVLLLLYARIFGGYLLDEFMAF